MFKNARTGISITYSENGANSLPTSQTPLVFSGGDDGSDSLVAADIVGRDDSMGLQAFRNQNAFLVRALLAPGYTDEAVISELISIANARMKLKHILQFRVL